MGADSFTLLDILRRAAAHKGLKLQNGEPPCLSEPITTYRLDERLLAVLEDNGIRRQPRSDCTHEIFTLVDENPQKKIPGWSSSDYWNFKLVANSKTKFDMKIILCVGFGFNYKARGISLVPHAPGTFVSPVDQLPNFRMFRALVQSGGATPAVAKELAASDGTLTVTFTDLGLGGIRSISQLFSEFAGGNGIIDEIGLNGDVFEPAPHPRNQQPGDELFVAEPSQGKVFDAWKNQLAAYRAKLDVA